MFSRLLHVPERYTSVQRHDERVPKAVRRDLLADPGSPREPLDDAVSGGAVHPPPVACAEDRTTAALTEIQVQRPRSPWRQGHGDVRAALAHDPQRAMTPFVVEILDVGVQRVADAQTVYRQQRHQRVIPQRSETRLNEEGAEFVRSNPSVRDS